MSVGTAASQFIDCPWHANARHITTWPSFFDFFSPLLWHTWPPAHFATNARFWQHGRGLLPFATCRQQLAALIAICGEDLIPNQARSNRAIFAAAIAYSGGRTLCSRAQANRSASVWQQHDRQHCSAEAHPHAQFEHGYNSSL
jgi:hypothetical protein